MSNPINLNKVKIDGKFTITKDKDKILNKKSKSEMIALFREKRYLGEMAKIVNKATASSLSSLGIMSARKEDLQHDIKRIRKVIDDSNKLQSKRSVSVDAIIGYESEAKTGKKTIQMYKRDDKGNIIMDGNGKPVLETIEGEGIVASKLKPIKFRNTIDVDDKSIGETLLETKKVVLQKVKEFRNKQRDLLIKSRNGKGRYSDIQFPIMGTGNIGYATPVGVHTEGGLIRGALILKRTGDSMFADKPSPTATDHYVGIEIECYTKCNRKTLALSMVCLDENIHKYVTIKDDGSLRPPSGYTSQEICIQAKESEVRYILNTVCKALQKNGGMVNSACGLHVHMDMRNRNRDDVYWNLLTAQDVLYSMQPKSREDGTYSKKRATRSETMPEPRRDASGTERYYGINYHSFAKHKTIEVRLHAGTVDFNKIANWVDLLVKVVNAPKRIRQKPKDVKSFAKAFSIGDDLAGYVNERINLFKANPTLEETA